MIASRGLPSNSQKAFLLTEDDLIARVRGGTVIKSAFHADGRWVRVIGGRIGLGATGWERVLPLGAEDRSVTVAWPPDARQILIGVWKNHELIAARNIRAGHILQDITFPR